MPISYEFLHLQDIVAGNTPDVVWADAYRRGGGRVVISGDPKIAYRPHEAAAFIDNDLLAFFPDECWGRMPGHARNAALIHAWPRIEALITGGEAASCWRIPCRYGCHSKELALGESAFQPLRIPPDILARVRAPRP